MRQLILFFRFRFEGVTEVITMAVVGAQLTDAEFLHLNVGEWALDRNDDLMIEMPARNWHLWLTARPVLWS